MVYSAALLALWLWLDLCGSSGAGFRWRSRLCCRRAGSGSSGVPLLALISGRRCRWGCVFASLRPRPFLGLVLRPLRCCLGVSRRSRVQCCGSSGAGAGRQCRPKGYSRMYNSVRLYLYDMLLAYCTKRWRFWLAIFTLCQGII